MCVLITIQLQRNCPLQVSYIYIWKKHRACSLRYKWVNEIEPPSILSKFSHILFLCLKWVWGIFKSILSFTSWVISHGNAVKLLSGYFTSKICIWKTNKQKNNKNLKMILKEKKVKDTWIPSHAVQCSDEEVLVQLVLISQDGALLKRHWHRCPVFGTFTTGETNTIKFATNL